MQINSFSTFLYNANNVSSYIPFVSTGVNLNDLFWKCVELPRMNKEDIANDHFFTYLKEKSFIRCIILLIPVLGNIVIGIYDFRNKIKGEKLRKEALQYRDGEGQIKDEAKAAELFQLAVEKGDAIAMNELGILYETGQGVEKDEIKATLLYKQAAIKGHVKAIYNLACCYGKNHNIDMYRRAASNLFKQAINKKLDVSRHVLVYCFLNSFIDGDDKDPFRDNRIVVLESVKRIGNALSHASARLRDDKEVVMEALKQNVRALRFASERLRRDPEIREFIREHAANIENYGENEHDQALKNYQNNLKELIKKSFVDLYDQPELVRLLSDKIDEQAAIKEGRELLDTFLATQQLANYVQLKEIENEIICPPQFEAEALHPYNNRYQKLMAAKASLNELLPNERIILVNKLLKISEYDLHSQGLDAERVAVVQKLFNDIGELAGQLHQGDLLVQKYVNLALLEEGVQRDNMDQVNAAYGAMNLFHGACREAWIERQVDAA